MELARGVSARTSQTAVWMRHSAEDVELEILSWYIGICDAAVASDLTMANINQADE